MRSVGLWVVLARRRRVQQSNYVFLASQEADYVNGEVIGVTGGMPLS